MNRIDRLTAILIQMQTKRVVKAEEMARSIGTTGRVALYGIFFDTDKAELKPESGPTLAEIAGLVKNDPKLAVLIVGHTDNQGAAYYTVSLKRNGALFSPAFSLGSGEFLMPDLLRLQTSRKMILRNLPSGNYEWHVEAYDHAFRGSGLSVSSTFTITDAPTGVTLDVLAYNKVKVNWQFTGMATHFAVLRRSSNGPLLEIGTVPSGIANFTDENVPPNEHIEYVVKAIFNGIYSAPSSGVAYYSGQFEQVSFDAAGPNIITASGVSADFVKQYPVGC